MNVWFFLALLLMGAGWISGNVVLILTGTVLAVAAFFRYRGPAALLHFGIVIALGWWFLFIEYPIGFAIPITAMFVSRQWRQRLKQQAEVAEADPTQAL